MVKIRYSELPAGLHVAAAADREGTVVYLQPGLTSAQRRAALVRVRSSARMGQGPTLPRPAMARAIAADRLRTNAGIGVAAARRHPMLFLPPVIALVVSATVFVFMTIQPLTVANLRNDAAAVPTLNAGAYNDKLRHHNGQHSAARSAGLQSRRTQSLSLACAAQPTPSSRWSHSAPPSRSSSRLAPGCLRRVQRWSRTQRL